MDADQAQVLCFRDDLSGNLRELERYYSERDEAIGKPVRIWKRIWRSEPPDLKSLFRMSGTGYWKQAEVLSKLCRS